MRTLLVEDEQHTAEMLTRGLREQTYAVDLAVDGFAALEKVAVNQYDLILKTMYTVAASAWRGDTQNDLLALLHALEIVIPLSLLLSVVGGL